MPLTLKDFRSSYPQYDDVPDEDLVQSLHQKFYADIPLVDFAKSIEAPVPTASAGDYGRALMSGFAGLAEAGGKGMTYVPGLEEVGKSIQETGKEAADYWRESMTPAGQAAMSNEIITDDFSLGETPLQSIGLQAMASAPSMLGAAIPGAGAVGIMGKIGGKTLQELAKHPGAIGFLAKYGPSATAFGASEGAIAALQNASQTEFEIRETPLDKLRAESPTFQRFYAETDPNLPPEQRDAMALDATAKAAADDVALKTFFSTGGIGIATGGGAMGWLQRMFGKEAAKEAAKKGFIRMVGEGAGTEFIQETPQSGAEQYIQQKAMQEHVDPTIDPKKGVTGAALSGGVVGAVLGGAGGAGGYVVRPRDDEREIALKVASAQTVDEAIAAATAAAEGAPATGIINQVLGGHASGVEVLPVIAENVPPGTEALGRGASGAEMLEPDYGQTLAQVGEGMYEPRQPAQAATIPAQDRRLPVVQPPRVIVTPEGQAATETQLAQQQAAQAQRERDLGITPDIRQQIEKAAPAPKAPTVEDIHALAEKKHIAWDNDPDFMDFTESVTGKRHLDELSEPELQALHGKLSERPDQEHKYSSSQVAVKGDISVKLRQAAKKLIAAEDVDPTEGLEKRPHITLKYGLRTADAAQLEQVLAGEGPITATIGNIEIFEPENEAYDVVVARVESLELTRLNQKVSAAIPNVDTHPEYKPHVTLGYVKKGTGKKYAQAKTGLEGKTLTFNAVEFSSRDGKITPIELKGATAPEAETPEAPAADETIKPNEHGVYDDEKAEKISHESKKASADVELLQLPDGWIYAIRYAHKQGNYQGGGSPLSKNKGAYPTRNEALIEGLKEIIEANVGLTTDVTAPEPQRAEARKIIDWAKAEIEKAGGKTEKEPPAAPPETKPKQPESTSAKAEKTRRAIERQMYTDALENSEIMEEAKGDLATFTKNADQIMRTLLQKEQSEAMKTRQADRAAAIGKILKDGLPKEFYESVHKAAQKAIKQAEKEAARDPAVYEAALTAALAGTNWSESEGATEFRQGWDHAIKGKTKSTLPSGEALDAGYKAAQKWLKTEEGRNYYEGKRGQKLENTGVALRRWFDGAKKRLSDVEGVDELIKEVEASTSRAEMFANVAGEGATPGTIRYLGNLANDIAPFKEWLTTHGPLKSLYGEYTKRRSTSERLLNYLTGKMYIHTIGIGKKDETTEERIVVVKEAAQTYLDTVGELVNALQGVKTIAEAAERYDKLFVTGREPSKYDPNRLDPISSNFSKKFEDFWRGRYSVWTEYLPKSWQTLRLIEKENDPTQNDVNRKQPLTPPRLDRVVRENLKDHRKGKDITPKKFKETFGFADVGFGKWVGTRQDQDHLNYAYDAFMDLADLLGIKPKDISLGGTLYFTIGALGHGKHAAHYSPNHPHPDGGTVPVINVTNTRGDGTLAHEWHHALDYHLRKASGNSPSIVPHIVREMKTRYDYDRVRNGVERMLRGDSHFTTMKKEGPLKNAYYAISYYAERGESKYKEEANKLDGNAREVSKLYWSNNEELFARASEAYVLDKLEGTNNYLVNPEWAGDGKIKPPMYRGTPYPEGDERKRFNEWFDAMYKSLDWTDAGPVLNKEKIRENMPKHRSEYDKALADLRAEIPEMKALIDAEDRAKILTKEQEAAQKLREEQDRIRAELEAQKAPPPPVGELNDDEISAAFDQAAAELQESTQEKPNAPNPGDDAVGNVIIDKPPPGGWTEADKVPPSVNRTAAKLASDAAKLGVKGIDEALKGLVELFGGGKIKSFPAGFDEESYQKAKPHFEAALKAFQDAGKTLVDLFKFLIEKFGLGIRPYAERFAKDQKLSMGLANAPSASRQIAGWVKEQLQAGNDIRWQDLFAQADKAYGGTQADGKYSVKDAYDAMEAGVNLYIRDANIRPRTDTGVDGAARDIGNLTRLLDSIPTQTKRTAEMDEYQQFSTPPPLAYTAAWAANIQYGESMLEPSAGIGGIAIFADMAGAQVVLNELSSRRAAVLKEVLPNARLFQENAEQLHNLLPDEIKPTVIVMNPPFSSTAGRMEGTRKTAVGAQHIEQALKRLAPKGRLVAIVGEGMGADKSGFREWWGKIKAEYNVRANVGVSGKNYAKYGTTFDNQVLVIDKTGPTKGDIVTGKVDTIEELIKLVEGVRNDRPATDQAGEPVTAQPGGEAVSDAGVAGEAGGAARPDADALGVGKRPGDQTATPATPDAGEGGSAAESARADETQPGDQVPDRSGRPGRPGRGRTAKAGEPGVGGEPAATDTAQQYDSAVKLGQAEKQKAEGELTEAIFEDYQPQRLKVAGAKPHPGKLVQSAAMAAVDPPAPTYTPNLPREVITEGKLSLPQLEAVVYAGQAHEQFLPDGSRRGFFIGDGTGVGKGREIAGIILDNLRQGRKKAVWISEKRGLFKDAGRDFAGVGGDKTLLFQQHKFPAVGKISPKGGIMFSTYSMLRGGEKKQATDKDKTPGKTRVAQIVEWLGPDFDGVIVFDEAHNMANAVQKKGERGKSDPSKQAMAGLELQKLLPKARVVYVSATGATEVSNLVYAQRLGLWGEGTAFSGSTDFVTKVDAGGVAAMELVARDLKALGSYIARSLSFDGVTYERLEHELTPLQTDVYNKLAEAWQIVLANVNQALEATLQGKNGRAKSAAMSRFWSTEQRFFNQVITSMQMPTIIDDARKRLDAGDAVVLQLVNTNEAEQERQVARAEQENIEIEELDFTPRQSLMDYVRNGFPVQQYEEYLDDEGNKQTRPVVDSQGNPVINKEMVEKRDALLKELEAIQVPDNPIDIILETFGPKMVGEVTGRSRRFIRQRGKDGDFKMIEEKRSASSAQDDAQAFMDDKRRVLIFSDAGGTGYSFHADNTQPNKRRRYHYLVQPGWRADKAVQGFGRTHRTDEASQPHYVLPTTSLKAQKRFISSIARRLDQLGALTKGQRQTGSQGLFNAADNLESKYATEAMQTFFEDLYANRTPLNTDETIGMMGLENLIDPKTGALNETKIPTVPKFLNRLLALDTEMQNKVFDEFFSRMEELVHNAIQKGTYDQGVETLKALNVHKLRDEVAYTDKRTGAETHYVELELTLPTEFHEWDEVQNRADLAKKDFAGYFLNNKTGKVFAMIHRGTRTGANGQLLKRAVQIHVAGSPRYIDNAGDIESEQQRKVFEPDAPHDDKGKPHYQKLDAAQAQEMWEKEHQTAPKTHTKTVHLISGAILPIWDRVTGQPKVIRTQTDEGERLLGRVVSDDDLKATLRNLGIGSGASKLNAGQILTRLERGASALLANGWQIKQVRVADDNRLEITATSFTAADQKLLKEQGAFIERINWRERVFIPTGDEAENILDRIIKNKPVVEIIEKGGAAEFSLTDKRVAYHGTSKGNTFYSYDASKARTGVGSNAFDQGDHFYLTTSKTAARWFAKRAEENKQLRVGKTPDDTGGSVIEFRLSDDSRVLDLEKIPRDSKQAAVILNDAKSKGYDAVSFPERGFETIEGDKTVFDMLQTEGLPRTIIVLNKSSLVQQGYEFSLASKLATKPDTINYADEETEATKDLRRGVEVALGRPLHKGAFTQVDTPESMEGVVKVIKTMFGKEVVFFRNNVPHIIAFNGMAPRHNKTTMYLNVDSTNPLVRVAGHELLHLLRREHKDIYNRLYRMALDEFKPEQVAAFTKNLDEKRQRDKQTGKTTEDLVHEEMLANFIGDNFARPEFWNALYKKSPSMLQRLAMLVRNFVTSVLKAANLRGYGSEYYFKDLERMREAAVNALSEYSQRKKAGVGEESAAEFSVTKGDDDIKRRFAELADAQRGKPESMFSRKHNKDVEHASGMWQFAMEHVGDLIHRAAQDELPDWGVEAVTEKVKKIKRDLDRKYPFEREVEDNIRNNYRYYQEDEGYTGDFETFRNEAYQAGERYAQAYEKLVPITKAQRLGKEAAIALGRRQWSDLRRAIDELDRMIETGQLERDYFTPETPAEFSLAETFNTETIAKITGDSGRDYSAAQQDAFKRVGREVEIPPLKERVKHLWTDAGKKLAQGLVDQFAPVKEISKEAYTLLRLSKGASGAFEVFLKGGKLKLSDGVYDYDDTQKGGVIERLLIPLQAENDDFMWWVAANRAEQLSREDREHLFSEDDIAALKALDNGTTEFDYTIQHGAKAGQVTRDRTLIYRDALTTFNEFNRNALDMAEQSYLIDGESRPYWEKEFYVPFYRVDEEEGLRGMNIKSGVVRQQAFKHLKGGSQKLHTDLLENTLMNWAHLLDAAAKNRAAKATLEAAERVGVAHKAEWGDKKTVWHMGETTDKEGKRRFGKVEYKVDDPYIMTAVSALEYAGMKGPLMDAMSQFKHWLTIGVTASPFFKIRNLIRDSVHAIGTSPLSYNIPGNVAKGFALTHPESDSYFRLLAGGGTIHFGTMLEGSESRRVRALVEAGVDKSTILDNEGKFKAFYKRMIEPSITAYNELGNRGEAINRASLYDQLIRQGKSHSEASLLARDLMDFSMGGAWTGIRFLTQTVPFLNARMQGLYKLGRSTKDDPRKLGIVLGATALFSIALMLAYEDDDDWKKREDWDRDSYWWFKIGGTAFRIPKPFEIGAMASLAERGVELFASDEMTGDRFRKRLYHLLSDNLSLNPVPQLVKPVLDIYANKDSFTGRPIETMGMERMRPEYRMRASTSMTARGISTAGNVLTGDNFLSPVQVDHLFRGYFGWLGSFVVGSADKIARPATGQISRPAPDYWKVATGGLVAEKESASSRYVTQMYEQAKEIEQAYGTWRMLLKSGKAEEAREFKEENIDYLKKYHPSQRIKRQESKLNERIRLIERSNKAPDEKRRMILDLQRQKDLLARRLSA